MTRRHGAAIVVILFFATAPFWVTGVDMFSHQLVSDISFMSQAQQRVSQSQSQPLDVELSNDLPESRHFNFSATWEDEDNTIRLEGNQDRVEIRASFSGETWDTIKGDVERFLESATVEMNVQN